MNIPRVTSVGLVVIGLFAAGCQLLAGVHNDAVVGAGSGGAGGGGPGPCMMDSDCNDRNPCTVDHCMGGVCSSVANDMAVPDDHNECTVDACKNGVASHDSAAMMGKKCGKGASTFCDAAGNCHGCVTTADCLVSSDCLSWTCDPMTSNCTGQNAPLGKAATDPMPGDCYGAFCDGSGGVVVSTLLARTVCTANSGKLCDGVGNCLVCILDSDCAMKQICWGGHCLLGDGEACTDPPLCASDRCLGGACAACTMDAQCTSGKCAAATGVCAAAYGEPCFATQDCVGGECVAGLCRLPAGSACMADTDCVTGFCTAGACATCVSSGECTTMNCTTVMGMAMCVLPTGAYCTDSTQCASGTCTGSPPKCQ